MKFDILKDWKTSLFGLVILAHLAYKLFWSEQSIDISTIISFLTAAGFIVAADQKIKKDEDASK